MESRITNNDNNVIKEVRELFNELRSNFSREEKENQIETIKKKLFIIF